jgi:hypothetical protein
MQLAMRDEFAFVKCLDLLKTFRAQNPLVNFWSLALRAASGRPR